MKTIEEMAMEYIKDVETARNPSVAATAFPQMQRCFLAGYKAAKDEYKVAIDTYNDVAKQMLEEAVRIMSPKEQLADAGKVMPQWISVKDRLPEDDREVLVVLNGESYKDIHVSWHDGEDFGWATTGYVSHWMELPAPPKEEE